MSISILSPVSVKDISKELLLENGKLKLLSSEDYGKYKWENVRFFCHQYARYGLPTIECVEYIKGLIGEREAIEIGSGHGDLGYHLGIRMTDSKIQNNPIVKKSYQDMRQPVIEYPDDVEEIDALDAVRKYKPQVVVASWITPYSPVETTFGSNPFGVKEAEILGLVETFIIVGNLDTHWDKPIRKHEHEVIKASWLWSRGKKPKNNVIFVWDKR